MSGRRSAQLLASSPQVTSGFRTASVRALGTASESAFSPLGKAGSWLIPGGAGLPGVHGSEVPEVGKKVGGAPSNPSFPVGANAEELQARALDYLLPHLDAAIAGTADYTPADVILAEEHVGWLELLGGAARKALFEAYDYTAGVHPTSARHQLAAVEAILLGTRDSFAGSNEVVDPAARATEGKS